MHPRTHTDTWPAWQEADQVRGDARGQARQALRHGVARQHRLGGRHTHTHTGAHATVRTRRWAASAARAAHSSTRAPSSTPSTPVPSCTAIALLHRSGSVVLLRYKRSAPFHRRVTALDRRVCTSVPLPDAYVTHGRSNVRFACTLVGELVQADFEEEPVFHLQFPRACSNVPSELLNPVCRNGFVRDYAPLSVHGTLIRRSHAVRTVGQAANWKDQELFKQTQEKLGQVPPPHGACSAARCMLRSAMQRRTVHVACCTVHVARCNASQHGACRMLHGACRVHGARRTVWPDVQRQLREEARGDGRRVDQAPR